MKKQNKILTKNRIKLFVALAVILIVGFTNTLLHLRPVSDRKKNDQEKIDYKTELKNTNKKIDSLTKLINIKDSDSKLLLNRAQLYKSINKYNNAIVDYNNFIQLSEDVELKSKAQKELKYCKTIKNHLTKTKS